ncbi:MAG: quercetin dioxygenase-like cupin family protein [Saprospiraceae bacterium]|jgi:quercetin dioxygenase-like cupin family protein|tara:strand:- start:1484 stop:1819 length:336 start_codon:yes stop_codon:yes gene_type:complete
MTYKININIAKQIMTLADLNEQLQHSDKPLIASIMKSDNTKLMAIGINSGVTLKQHTAPGRTKLIVIQGQIKYMTDKEILIIDQYQTHDIPLEEVHSVNADTPSIFLLLVA